VSDAERERGRGDEHQVTPLELFFDLTFVFAITQVTSLLADDPTWHGVFRGMLVLAALWWAWSVYAWLTSTMDVDARCWIERSPHPTASTSPLEVVVAFAELALAI
jgi:low temperature requirement protein LtrA